MTRKRPASARILTQWVDAYALRTNQSRARVRRWVSYTVLGGALVRAGGRVDGPAFTIKGGVALEFRMRERARATQDLDVVVNRRGEAVSRALISALAEPYEGFSFLVKEEPKRLPNGTFRMDVALLYLDKPWGTVQVDVTAAGEGEGLRGELVEAFPLAPFGIDGPDALPCIPLPHHVAEKIHGMTLPAADGRRNDRFRDLVDLLLLRTWVTDLAPVRSACVEVFARRGTHAWPPPVDAHEHWRGPFAAMAAEVGVAPPDLAGACEEARRFLREIESAAGTPHGAWSRN